MSFSAGDAPPVGSDTELGDIMQKKGLNEAIDHLFSFLYKEGMPTENVYNMCSKEIKRFGKEFEARKLGKMPHSDGAVESSQDDAKVGSSSKEERPNNEKEKEENRNN
eukprot:jgi/Bigna1/134832/aug1.27_g9540